MQRSLRAFVLLLSILAAAVVGPVARAADDTTGARPRVADAVVSVVVSNGMGMWRGSGFCVGDGSWVVTCRHVVAVPLGGGKRWTARQVTVLSPWTGEAAAADVVAVDESADLALLRLKQPGLPALRLADEAERSRLPGIAEGGDVRLAVAGCAQPVDGADPDTEIGVLKREGALLTQRSDKGVDYLVLAPTPDVGKGWSGGPLFRPESGVVVGVFHALIARKSDPGLWFPQSVAVAQLEALLRQAGVKDLAPFRSPPPPAAPRPADAAALFRHEFRADALTVMRKWPEVETECRAILKLRPENARAHCELAIALEQQGRHDDALAEFRESARLDPKRARTHMNYGIALQNLARLKEAEEEMRQATELAPDDAEAWSALGQVLSAAKRHEEAVKAYRKAIALTPNHPLVRWNLGLSLMRVGQLDDGIAELREAVSLSSNSAAGSKLRMGLAGMLQAAGRLEAAEAEYRLILQESDDDAAVHLLLATCLEKRGQKEEALTHARRCLELKPSARLESTAQELLRKLEGAAATGR